MRTTTAKLRLTAERTRDGMAVAWVEDRPLGRRPIEEDTVSAALELVAARVRRAEPTRQLGLGRSTIYREVKRLGIARPA